MKKKVFLIVAIIVIAIIACMALVACDGTVGGNNSGNNGNDSEEIIGGGNNQGGNTENGGNHSDIENGGNDGGNNEENIISPNATIKEYMNVWKASSSKSFYQPAYGDIKITIHGNICMFSDLETIKYLEITEKNKANYFYGPIDSADLSHWEILKLESIEDICDYLKFYIEMLPEVSAPKDIINIYGLMVFGGNDPDLIFEKKDDGIYYGIKGSDYEDSTIKIVGNDLIYTFPIINREETEEGKFIFTLGSDPITIPQYLRDALENGQTEEKQIIPNDIIERWNNTNSKKFTLIDNQVVKTFIYNDNIIVVEIIRAGTQEEIYFLERSGNDLNEYRRHSMGEWQAYTRKDIFEEQYANMNEVFDILLNDMYGDSEIFTIIEHSKNTDNMIYNNGIYIGKADTILENYRIFAHENDVRYLDINNAFEFTCTLGADPITIPQEAIDALEDTSTDEEKIIPNDIIDAWNSTNSKKFTVIDNEVVATFIYNDNIIVVEIIRAGTQEEIYFLERSGNDLNEYRRHSMGEWQAYTRKDIFEEQYANMNEVFDILLNDMYGDSEIFTIIEHSKNTDNMIYNNGIYIGKADTILENYRIFAHENDVRYLDINNAFEFTCTLGADPIIIPQEAKDALAKNGQEQI